MPLVNEALNATRGPFQPAPNSGSAQRTFRVFNLDDSRRVAQEIASFCPRPKRALLGLLELLVNAVEHGNLGISFDEKSRLCEAGNWELEVARRLALPEHAGKMVQVRFEKHSGENHVWIRDTGPGFKSAQYLSSCPKPPSESPRCMGVDLHGRGIALASIASFDWLEYLGSGNEVHAMILDHGALVADYNNVEVAN